MSIETELKVMFRTQELAERSRRREALLQRMKQEEALMDEPLLPEDVAATKAAIARLALKEEIYRREVRRHYGYWKRLWWAIKGL